MGVYMRTTGVAVRHVLVVIVGPVIRRNVVRVGVMGGSRQIMHMRVSKGMRFGKLRRVQDRQLAAAEHRHGEQRRNQDMLYDPAHMHTKPAYLTFVKGKAPHPKTRCYNLASESIVLRCHRHDVGSALLRNVVLRGFQMTTTAVKATLLTLAALAMSGAALAHGFEDCTNEPKDKWQPQAKAEAAATAAGYTVTTSEVEGSCYEVHVKDKDGNPHELFYNPVDLELVQTHDE